MCMEWLIRKRKSEVTLFKLNTLCLSVCLLTRVTEIVTTRRGETCHRRHIVFVFFCFLQYIITMTTFFLFSGFGSFLLSPL